MIDGSMKYKIQDWKLMLNFNSSYVAVFVFVFLFACLFVWFLRQGPYKHMEKMMDF